MVVSILEHTTAKEAVKHGRKPAHVSASVHRARLKRCGDKRHESDARAETTNARRNANHSVGDCAGFFCLSFHLELAGLGLDRRSVLERGSDLGIQINLMNYYPHHIGDFNNATRHLTRVERSLYRDLIELYYDTEQPLPADDFDRLARRVIAIADDEIAALKYVLGEFFELDDDVYRHSRCDEEIEKYQANSSAKAKAGKASAEARRKKAQASKDRKKAEREQKGTGVEQALNGCATNQEPITNNQEPVKTYASFDEFWSLYPKKVNRTKTEAKWEKLKVTDDLFSEIAENIRARLAAGEWREGEKKFIPDPLTYLNGKRWEDEIIPPVAPSGQDQPRTGYQTAQQLRAQRDEETFDYERMTRF